MTSLLIALAIGLGAGVASGIFGIGGGIIIVPMLGFFLGMTQTQATATSLAAMLLPVGALGVWQYWKAGQINQQQFIIAGLVALGLLTGAFFASKIALGLNEALLRKAFATLLALIAARLFVK